VVDLERHTYTMHTCRRATQESSQTSSVPAPAPATGSSPSTYTRQLAQLLLTSAEGLARLAMHQGAHRQLQVQAQGLPGTLRGDKALSVSGWTCVILDKTWVISGGKSLYMYILEAGSTPQGTSPSQVACREISAGSSIGQGALSECVAHLGLIRADLCRV
jgi:hypothetical protein